ncbi:MAG: hypothetical protein BGO10_04065 [Chlamydia sp. 32-24]|nr:MAG: hypothetical protein BGO10_04065 [Chlamydia sp. 32-24]
MEKNLLRNLRQIVFHYKFRFLFAIFLDFCSNLLLVSNPLLMREAITFLTGNKPSLSFPLSLFSRYADFILFWVILFFTIAVAVACLRYSMRVIFFTISREAEMAVRSLIFKKIQKQSRAFYDKYEIGELLSRLTNDVSAYRDVLGPGMMYPIYVFTLMIPAYSALFFISHTLFLVALLPLLLVPIVNAFIKRKVYKHSKLVQYLLGRLSSLVQEHYSGIRIIKGYQAENDLFRSFSQQNVELAHQSYWLTIYEQVVFPFLSTVTKSLTIVLVIVASFLILSYQSMTLADFVSFMWIQSYIFFPIVMLTWLLPIYERGKVAYERLFEIFNEPIEVTNDKGKYTIPINSEICFHNLTFAYPLTDRTVLKNINLCIKPGTFVGITGPIGSGKSTLFKLLNREYEIPNEMITIGGKDIHEYKLDSFNETFVTVEQLPFLFSTTIAENISIGKELVSKEELDQAAEHALLHETILEFPNQWETMVGEKGVMLSGGQKQRVAMARAFIVNRSILLLDDIFSAIDSSTQKKIFASMKKNFIGKTILLITHKVSLLKEMDRILYLHDGQIIEDGTPGELLNKKGAFSALAALQGQDDGE